MTDQDRDSNLPVSEAAMFKVVVVVGIALVPVFVLSIVAGAGWAAVLLGFEIGIAIGILWRRRRLRQAEDASGEA